MMPKSKFLEVECPECGNKQVVFGSSSTEVKCSKCNFMLVAPKGGKSAVKGKIVKVLT